MAVPAPEIADNGDIYVHGRDELALRVTIEGDPITGHPVYLEIKGVTRRLLADEGESRLLVLTEEDLLTIPANGADYVLRDEFGPQKRVLLEGKIRWRGWNK